MDKKKEPLLAKASQEELEQLAGTIRQDLITSVTQTGGHLSSNLGTVELTLALHRVFDTAIDRLVFDVGHQCYGHKMLTGRKEAFATLRQHEGLSGFPKPSESPHDAFVAGHASNSVAVAVGMAKARELTGGDYDVIALLGDGALTGGLAYEGLAVGGQTKGQLLVILNDNGMSITKNVGGISTYLAKQRIKPQYLHFRRLYRRILGKNFLGRKIHSFNHGLKQAVKHSLLPSSMFEQMGFTYYGPVDGHDISLLTKLFTHAKEQDCPVLVHVRTIKGKGYPLAEKNPEAYHGISASSPTKNAQSHYGINKSSPTSGDALTSPPKTFSQVFGETMAEEGAAYPSLCGITAAMSTGTGMDLFAEKFPHRLYDVGIAEGCAITMAGGLAKEGAIPVFAVYSTFLQRAYDMMIHDVALQHLPVIFAVDRCGLVGEDGETHHGVFDLAFLSTVPNLTVLAPSSLGELKAMLTASIAQREGAVAIRYPRGTEGMFSSPYTGEAVDILETGTDITLISHGIHINHVLACSKLLKKEGFSPEVLKVNRLSSLEGEKILASLNKTGCLLVAEDVIAQGSLGENIASLVGKNNLKVQMSLVNTGNTFVSHGKVSILEKELGLDSKSLFLRSQEVLSQVEREKTKT
ncbi:MAG: 1-deoxy-D-xylulose-5-phosphate synthase [Eubacteriales bacterium]